MGRRKSKVVNGTYNKSLSQWLINREIYEYLERKYKSLKLNDKFDVKFISPNEEQLKNYDLACNIIPDNSSFNLFVLDGERFSSRGYFMLKRNECLRHTDKQFSNLKLIDEDTKTLVCKFPCIFANRNESYKSPAQDQSAFFGYITGYEVLSADVKFYFSISSAIPQILINSNTDLFNLKSSDGDNELDIVHWSIKQINVIETLKKLNFNVASF